MVGVDHIRWNNDGLVPVIAQDFTSKEILMLAWANREAVALTESTGLATIGLDLDEKFGSKEQLPEIRKRWFLSKLIVMKMH